MIINAEMLTAADATVNEITRMYNATALPWSTVYDLISKKASQFGPAALIVVASRVTAELISIGYSINYGF